MCSVSVFLSLSLQLLGFCFAWWLVFVHLPVSLFLEFWAMCICAIKRSDFVRLQSLAGPPRRQRWLVSWSVRWSASVSGLKSLNSGWDLQLRERTWKKNHFELWSIIWLVLNTPTVCTVLCVTKTDSSCFYLCLLFNGKTRTPMVWSRNPQRKLGLALGWAVGRL